MAHWLGSLGSVECQSKSKSHILLSVLLYNVTQDLHSRMRKHTQTQYYCDTEITGHYRTK